MISGLIKRTAVVVTSLEGRSQSFKGRRAKSGPLTALIGYFKVLLIFQFLLAGHNQHLGGASPWLRPCKPASCINNEIRYN